MFVSAGCIYSGSVGDSRAVLGTLKLPQILPVPTAEFVDKKILEEVRGRRSSKPDIKIKPLQLTKDQKPNDREERIRIESSGGRVQRLLDEFGKKIGPYRVWEKSGNYPGLAMSRSIGDLVAKRIGVANTPVCTYHEINSNDDLFFVLGSDGLWDVMDNEDVINFVECYRELCTNETLNANGGEITVNNSCIAQILAEEARLRWYSIVEEEDVCIDDITCIVIEIKESSLLMKQHSRRPVPENVTLSLEEIDENQLIRAPTIVEIVIRDPKRSSVVAESLIKVEID